jgi:hypothetical protein
MTRRFWRLGIFAIIMLAAFAAAQTKSATVKKKQATVPAASQQDVQALRELVQTQQKQLETQNQQLQELQGQLRQVLDSVQQANANAQKVQAGADQAQVTATQAQQSAEQAQQTASEASSAAAAATSKTALLETNAKPELAQLKSAQSLLGRFRLSGDIRVRGENYTQSGAQDRNRARIRIRLGVDGKLNEDFVGGVAVATGSLGDPTTTNETLNAFDRKSIGLDRGFITYNPVAHNWLSLTGGKFAYLWQRTSVTGDPDLNPEGFDQKLSFNYNGLVKNFTVQALELLFNESSSGQDSYVLGVQTQAKLQAGPWSAVASFLNQHWNRPDALLQASAFQVQATTTGSTTVGSFPVPGEGPGCATNGNLPKFAPCAFAANGMTNATFIDAAGKAHFASGFDIADFILNNQFKTGASRLPLNLVLEFEENLDAAAHPLSAAKGTPVLTTLGSQNKEYGADISLGQSLRRNDVQFGYSWYRQEQDSALASIAESDQRAPTNILQNKIYAAWKVRSNVVANFTWWHGRVLNTYLENNGALYNNWGGTKSTITTAGQQEPWLNRLQFDLIYTY